MGVLTLVRHGQASFHDDDYDKLSPLGEEQVRRLGEHWIEHGTSFDRVVSGPLQRQIRSAELVRDEFARAGLAFPDIEIHDALAEMPVERLAKRFMPQLCAEDEECLAMMNQFMSSQDKREKERLFQKAFERLMLKWAQKQYHDDEIESFERFVERVKQFITGVNNGTSNGRRIAVFTSGGPTAVAVHHALGTSFETTLELVWQVRNASLTEFLFTNGRFTLSSFNNVSHLRDPGLWTYR